MEELARAKLNLALHVRGRESDGYHRIETIFAFTEAGDRLSVAEGDVAARLKAKIDTGLKPNLAAP